MTIQLAEALATSYHEGQQYGSRPYTYHLEMVVDTVYAMYAADPDLDLLVQIAWLHDILEDTAILPDILETVFDPRVVEAVTAITKCEDIDYFTYIKHVKDVPLARKVKIADSLSNLTCSLTEPKRKKLVDKYTKVLKELYE